MSEREENFSYKIIGYVALILSIVFMISLLQQITLSTSFVSAYSGQYTYTNLESDKTNKTIDVLEIRNNELSVFDEIMLSDENSIFNNITLHPNFSYPLTDFYSYIHNDIVYYMKDFNSLLDNTSTIQLSMLSNALYYDFEFYLIQSIFNQTIEDLIPLIDTNSLITLETADNYIVINSEIYIEDIFDYNDILEVNFLNSSNFSFIDYKFNYNLNLSIYSNSSIYYYLNELNMSQYLYCIVGIDGHSDNDFVCIKAIDSTYNENYYNMSCVDFVLGTKRIYEVDYSIHNFNEYNYEVVDFDLLVISDNATLLHYWEFNIDNEKYYNETSIENLTIDNITLLITSFGYEDFQITLNITIEFQFRTNLMDLTMFIVPSMIILVTITLVIIGFLDRRKN